MVEFTLFEEYDRPAVASSYGYDPESAKSGFWATGVVKLRDPKEIVLFVTLDKSTYLDELKYREGFLNPTVFQWQTQNRASTENEWGKRHLEAEDRGVTHHLFIRGDKKDLFTYVGAPTLQAYEGSEPITITWQPPEPVPRDLLERWGQRAALESQEALEIRLAERDSGLSVPSGSLDRTTLGKARKEQEALRMSLGLRGANTTETCQLCGRELPVELLVAAHVKPRHACTTKERLDIPSIGMRACLLGCDGLYEEGYICVGATGYIIATAHEAAADLQATLKDLVGTPCTAWNEDREPYFEWHRDHVFRS